MKNKKSFWVWCISIIVITMIIIANTVITLFGIPVPDIVIRILGIMQLITLPFVPILVFVIGKGFMTKKPEETESR